MSTSIELPEEIAARLRAALPETEHVRFAVAAIASALDARAHEETPLLEPTLADVDPERDSAECIAAVEEALADMDAGGPSYSLEEVERILDEAAAARVEARRYATPAQ
jgi:hypothetical protein